MYLFLMIDGNDDSTNDNNYDCNDDSNLIKIPLAVSVWIDPCESSLLSRETM